MDLLDQTNKCIKERVEELERKYKVKLTYTIFSDNNVRKIIDFKGQYYLSDESH